MLYLYYRKNGGATMGIYLNPSNTDFYNAVNHSQIYIDKTNLIEYTNKVLFGEQKFICVSRPRRFGKSMAANMLTAYYSRGCDSKEIFANLKISKHHDFEKHLNQYNVIHLNIPPFMDEAENVQQMIRFIKDDIMEELLSSFLNVQMPSRKTLDKVFATIFNATKIPFIFIIDEWDCIFREHKENKAAQEAYLKFLRNLLKNQQYVALVYMTGILPIKKYGDHSALNMFDEYSMTNQMALAEFAGFTEHEVKSLCEEYGMSFEETKRWYDGYDLKGLSIYNPRSVVMAMTSHDFDNYWTKTETYESIRTYIEMNYDGLRDTIIRLIAGERKKIDTTTFTNDMVTFEIQDDVLTLLIHLGYIAYDSDAKEIFIPNFEIREQFISTVRVLGWNDVMKSLQLSEKLLQATIGMNEEKVAEIVEQVHRENTSILQYNNENSLSCVLSLAYYSAKKDYAMYRELASGDGFADLVFVPRSTCQTPAFIVELKWNQSAETAIEQIRQKKYVECLKDYSGEILLVGINYDKDDKQHTCKIEKITK